MKTVKEALKTFGYLDTLILEDSQLKSMSTMKVLLANDLFFVDEAFAFENTYLFAISSPLHNIKALLSLSKDVYAGLIHSSYALKFNIPITSEPFDDITISHQYGMRKISKHAFDFERYILRKGFPNFPACPYGHTFKMLGYDTQSKEYVRLSPKILKDKMLKIEVYNG